MTTAILRIQGEYLFCGGSSDRGRGEDQVYVIVKGWNDRDGNHAYQRVLEIERKRSDINDIEVFNSFTSKMVTG